MLHRILRDLEIRVAKLEGEQPPSAEQEFFDNPQKREVREFAETKAITNVPVTAQKSTEEADCPRDTRNKAVQKARKAPPTPTDNKRKPGGREFSTLNRFIVETEEDVPPSVPQDREEIPKAEKPPASLEAKKSAIKRAYYLRNYGK